MRRILSWVGDGIRRYSVLEMSAGSYAMILSGFVRTALLARLLGPAPYGLMVFVIGLVNTLFLLLSLEPDGAVTRFVAEDAARDDRAGVFQKIKAGFILSFVRGGVVIFLFGFCGEMILRLKGAGEWTHAQNVVALAFIYAVAEGFYSIERTANSVLNGLKAFRSLSYQLLASAALGVLFPVLFAQRFGGVEMTLWGFVAAQAAAMILSLGLAARALRHRFGKIYERVTLRWKELRSFARFCIYSSLNSTANASSQSIDVVILNLFLPYEVIGFYNIGVKFTRMAGLTLQPLRTILFPLLSEDWGMGRIASIRSRVRRFMQLGILAAVPLCAVLYFGSDQLIIWYVGRAYLPAAMVLRISLISAAVLCVMSYNRTALMAVNYPEGVLYFSLMGAALRVAGSFLLIPLYGLAGAAWTENLVTVGMNGYAYLLQRRRWHRREQELLESSAA